MHNIDHFTFFTELNYYFKLNKYNTPDIFILRSNTWATCNSLVPARQIVSVLDYPIFHPVNERDNIFYSVSIVHVRKLNMLDTGSKSLIK